MGEAIINELFLLPVWKSEVGGCRISGVADPNPIVAAVACNFVSVSGSVKFLSERYCKYYFCGYGRNLFLVYEQKQHD